jgi:hypothetical protein
MGRGPRVLLSAVAISWLLPACDKTDAPPPGSIDPAATATASAPSVVGSDEVLGATTSPTPPEGSASHPRGSARDAGGATPDGGPTPKDAPLLFWMQAHTAAALRQGDSAALAAALEELATFAPKEPGYPNWASIAKDGADAARAGSVEGVKAACRGCHAQYRASYKAALRARPLAPDRAR